MEVDRNRVLTMECMSVCVKLNGEWFELAYSLATGAWADDQQVLEVVGKQYYKTWHKQSDAQVSPGPGLLGPFLSLSLSSSWPYLISLFT